MWKKKPLYSKKLDDNFFSFFLLSDNICICASFWRYSFDLMCFLFNDYKYIDKKPKKKNKQIMKI